MKKIKLTVFLLLSVFSAAFAQFEDGIGNTTGDAEFRACSDFDAEAKPRKFYF